MITTEEIEKALGKSNYAVARVFLKAAARAAHREDPETLAVIGIGFALLDVAVWLEQIRQ